MGSDEVLRAPADQEPGEGSFFCRGGRQTPRPVRRFSLPGIVRLGNIRGELTRIALLHGSGAGDQRQRNLIRQRNLMPARKVGGF